MFKKNADGSSFFAFRDFYRKKDENPMKKKAKPGLWPDVSILIVTCLAITTFIRGAWQFWLLFAAFAVWCTYAVCNHLLPFLWEQRDQKEARDLRKLYEKRQPKQQAFTGIDVSDPVAIVLLRHASHRISANLKAVYPDATWEWCVENPERIAAKGGVARIRLHGAADYNFAEVTLDQDARISFHLLKMVPFGIEDCPYNKKVDFLLRGSLQRSIAPASLK